MFGGFKHLDKKLKLSYSYAQNVEASFRGYHPLLEIHLVHFAQNLALTQRLLGLTRQLVEVVKIPLGKVDGFALLKVT